MSKERITGRENEWDEAERWLANNDPEYTRQSKKWQTRSTDALARDRNVHDSLRDHVPLEPRDSGNYYRRRSNAEEEYPFEYSDVDDKS